MSLTCKVVSASAGAKCRMGCCRGVAGFLTHKNRLQSFACRIGVVVDNVSYTFSGIGEHCFQAPNQVFRRLSIRRFTVLGPPLWIAVIVIVNFVDFVTYLGPVIMA